MQHCAKYLLLIEKASGEAKTQTEAGRGDGGGGGEGLRALGLDAASPPPSTPPWRAHLCRGALEGKPLWFLLYKITNEKKSRSQGLFFDVLWCLVVKDVFWESEVRGTLWPGVPATSAGSASGCRAGGDGRRTPGSFRRLPGGMGATAPCGTCPPGPPVVVALCPHLRTCRSRTPAQASQKNKPGSECRRFPGHRALQGCGAHETARASWPGSQETPYTRM